jgi:hypothetical protein
MSTHNNLGPRHLPTWSVTIFFIGLALAAGITRPYFKARADWFALAAYIGLLFAAIVCSFRPAWGRRVFWISVGILLGLHILAGLVLVLLFPRWLDAIGSFLTVVVVSDSLLTMSILWRMSAAKRQRSH